MDLADRMKLYEKAEAGRRLLPKLPICVRIDGRSFSSYTRPLQRPFDERLSQLMIEVTRFVTQQSGALVGYTQSDEISLVLHSDRLDREVFFNGKVQKLCSVLASMTTARFHALNTIEELEGQPLAMFDARVWAVPDLEEAANVLLWRELDATRNSIEMAGRACFSQQELHKKNTDQIRSMLLEKDVDWSKYPSFFKRGTYVLQQKFERTLTEEERDRIPLAHRPAPDATFERTSWDPAPLPPLRQIKNRVQVLFFGAEPELEGA